MLRRLDAWKTCAYATISQKYVLQCYLEDRRHIMAGQDTFCTRQLHAWSNRPTLAGLSLIMNALLNVRAIHVNCASLISEVNV